jgi:starch phosphorylase
LGDPEKPVQLVFAGKAHPADKPGQALISTIQSLSQDPRFLGKVLFLEDYDMAVGRAMTRGVDVWLNNPRRPLEASGTSGQKAAMNGILNLSILDGWWPEGFDGDNGWAIGSGVNVSAAEAADDADADALYDLLEREVVPLYYDRGADGVPQGWLERSKGAIATISPAFNARRMVKDYVETFYAPAAERARVMAKDDFAAASELAAWRHHIQNGWYNLYISAKPLAKSSARVGEALELEVTLHPRDFTKRELCVELVYSAESDKLETGLHKVTLECVSEYDDGGCLYRARFRPEVSGQLAYGVRVYPTHKYLVSPFDAYAIRWA